MINKAEDKSKEKCGCNVIIWQEKFCKEICDYIKNIAEKHLFFLNNSDKVSKGVLHFFEFQRFLVFVSAVEF